MTIHRILRSLRAVTAVGVMCGLAGSIAASPVSAHTDAADTDAALNWVVNSAPGSSDADAVASAIADAGGTMLISYPEIGVTIARAPDDGFDGRLRGLPQVQSVGPTRTSTAPDRLPEPASSAAGVTAEPSSMPAEGTAWNTVAIGATSPSGDGVVVGVADNGIDSGHPDLADRIDPSLSVGCGVNGVPDTRPAAWRPSTGLAGAHGTHVAGSVAGSANGTGIRGIAPDARVAAIKVDNQDGFIYPEASICATMWAVQRGIPIMNHSYFVDPWYVWCADALTQSAAIEALRRAYAFAHDNGVLTIAAVGNEAQDLSAMTTDVMSPGDGEIVARPVDDSCVQAPGGLPGVVSVAAADQDEATGSLIRAGFSNYGAGKVTVTAPGVVWSSVPLQSDGSIYASFPGTSMAAPHVAGLAARLLSEEPTLTADDLAARIAQDAVPLAGASEAQVGAGLIGIADGDEAPTVGVYTRVALTGQPFRVSGSGYAPRSSVELRIGDATETVETDAAGRFATVFPIPDDIRLGTHTLEAGAASAPITVRESPDAPRILTPRSGATVYATSTKITGTGVPGSSVRVHVADGELTPFLRFVRVGGDGNWSVSAPLVQGDYEVTARTVVGEDSSAPTAAVPFGVHTAPAITYSAQLAPRPGSADDTLIVVDLGNAGATTGEGIIDIDLTGYEHYETPAPSVGTIERTDRGVRWTVRLDATQSAQVRIAAHAATDDPPFPTVTVTR